MNLLTSYRIRKVKCDEAKPLCQKCTRTGRGCDGYGSPFRHLVVRVIESTLARPIATNDRSSWDIELLNRYFSTKTLHNVDLDCDGEARQIIRASLTDQSIRHAIMSLKTLREDLESSGDNLIPSGQQTLSHYYGIEQYSMALGGLASSLTSLTASTLKSTLLCCQIFISIEQVRKNYSEMTQHIVRGLDILHQYRVRPILEASDRVISAYSGKLPLLDIFIIKLFAAPCKFADAPTDIDTGELTPSECPMISVLQSTQFQNLRKLAPDVRTELERIAASTIELLGKVSQIRSVDLAHQLLFEKAALLKSLDVWHRDLRPIQEDIKKPELVSVSFLRMFYSILKIILLGTIESSPNSDAERRHESDRLQTLAASVTDRVKTYVTCVGTSQSKGSTPLSVK